MILTLTNRIKRNMIKHHHINCDKTVYSISFLPTVNSDCFFKILWLATPPSRISEKWTIGHLTCFGHSFHQQALSDLFGIRVSDKYEIELRWWWAIKRTYLLQNWYFSRIINWRVSSVGGSCVWTCSALPFDSHIVSINRFIQFLARRINFILLIDILISRFGPRNNRYKMLSIVLFAESILSFCCLVTSQKTAFWTFLSQHCLIYSTSLTLYRLIGGNYWNMNINWWWILLDRVWCIRNRYADVRGWATPH